MLTDLCYATKEEELWYRLKAVRMFSSIMVQDIGREIYYKRAERTVREWVHDCPYGKIRRMDLKECRFRGLVRRGQAPLVWWEILI